MGIFEQKMQQQSCVGSFKFLVPKFFVSQSRAMHSGIFMLDDNGG